MKNKLIKIIISAILFVVAFILKDTNIKILLFLIGYLVVGFSVLKEAFENIIKGKFFDENFLMSVATIGAFMIQEFSEAVAVMLFYQVGELFQDYAIAKSKKSIASLMDIRPEYANILKDKEIKKVDPNTVKIDDIIVIKPGEKVPLDGVIIDGESLLDTKALTGETIPKRVLKDDHILSGAINTSGVIKVRVEKNFSNSTVSKILELVANATDKKTKEENFITKFAKVYTPIVVLVALLLAFISPLIFNISFNACLYRALSFLVVSCPCALVISIPLSFFGGIGAASKIGVLVKGSNYLEKLNNVDTIVFDKTGTLTEGVFEVIDVNPVNISKDGLLKLAVSAEVYSNHPISLSIRQAYQKEIDNNLIKETKEIPGYGIKALIDNKKVLVGNEKLLLKNNIAFKPCKDVGTIIYVACNKEYMGYIRIADRIKDDAYRAIDKFKKIGINNFVMLTGDKEITAKYVAQELGISSYYASLLPDGKVKKMLELKQKSNIIFVGDGINDALVLAEAPIGVGMGAIGSDAAIEASDIVLMNDELSKIPEAIYIAKKTVRIVKENIYFIILIKILVLVLSALGISTMWEAVFADVGVTVISSLNALRVLIERK